MILSPESKVVLFVRIKSLCWSLGTMIVPVFVDFFATNLSLFNLPSWLVVILGLALAQVTKYLNTPR